jgi:branched-chain amino acid transport system permease protein
MNTVLDIFGTYGYFARNGLITIVLAYSVFLLLNAGIFAVPQIGLMAVGGYVASVVDLRWGWPMPLSLAAGVVGGAVVGALLGGLLARLNGIYLALATIAFSEIVRVAAQNLKVTGGLQGLFGIDADLSDLYILAGLLVCAGGVWSLSRSRHGLAIAGMRADALMTGHQGVHIKRYRIGLFAGSGALAALAGALSVHLSGFVEPGAYSFAALTTVLAAVILGGMTSQVGPFIGVAIMLGVPQVLSWLADYRDLVSGVVIVLVVALAPRGLGGWMAHVIRTRVRRRRASRVRSSEGEEAGIPPLAARSLVRSPNPDLNLSLDQVQRHFGGVKALQGVSFEVRAGEVFGLIGPNGSGKSTMLNVLSGVYRPTSGDIRLDGKSLARHFGHQAWLSRAGIARTFQNIRLVGDLTVSENILLGGYVRFERSSQRPPGETPGRRQRARQLKADLDTLVEEFGLRGILDQDPGALPYGLQRRVEICRALLSRPRLLLLDEPTAGMTPVERSEVFAAIKAVAERGIVVIVVEHDVESMLANCDRLATLNFGQLIALGSPQDVIESEEVIEAYVGRAARR